MIPYGALLLLLSVGFVLANYNYYNGYTEETYHVDDSPCNKSSVKVTNVVPVYDLCYWTKIEWREFKKRTDVSNCNLHGKEGNYIPSRNIPIQIRIYNGRVYVIINREIGVFSSISYFEIKDIKEDKKCPKLECLRECSRNQLADFTCNDDPLTYLINVRDIQFTACKQAWLLDIGVYFKDSTHDNTIINRPPRICLYDVSSSKAAQETCKNIPSKYYNDGNQEGFNTVLVNEEKGCGEHVVYIFNSKSATIVVYNQALNEFSAIRTTAFRPQPSQSHFYYTLSNYKEYNTIIDDGIYSGVTDKYGLIVSGKASKNPYFISYRVLNDKEKEDCSELTYNIKDLGDYNTKGQTYGIARNGDVLFFIQPQNHALVCANKKQKIEPDSLQYLVVDRCRFPHLTSIYLYKKNIYVLSNNLNDITANKFDSNKENFVISYLDTTEIDALYPECLSYFEQSIDHDCVDSKGEESAAYAIAAKNSGRYDLYNDNYQHKKCSEVKYQPDCTKKCLCGKDSCEDSRPVYEPCTKCGSYTSLEKILKPSYVQSKQSYHDNRPSCKHYRSV